MWMIVRQIVREDGVTGLFRGLTSTWAREVPGYFFFFGGYHFSRKILTPQGQDPNDLSKSIFHLYSCPTMHHTYTCDVTYADITMCTYFLFTRLLHTTQVYNG